MGNAGKAGRAVGLCLAAAGLAFPHAAAALPALAPAAQHSPRHADFAGQAPSPDARRVADWVIATGDNRGLPFLIIDKSRATVFAFDDGGRLGGAAPVLLGLGRGDDSPPGIGERKLATITPAERITPAGRFEAGLGDNLSGQDILWVDYDAAVSLHRVIAGKPAERRLQRLASASTLDNRITYGCINVPVKFYEGVIRSIFGASNGIVYVLPETRSIKEVFAIPDLAGPAALQR
jgi:hypothetical protein